MVPRNNTAIWDSKPVQLRKMPTTLLVEEQRFNWVDRVAMAHDSPKQKPLRKLLLPSWLPENREETLLRCFAEVKRAKTNLSLCFHRSKTNKNDKPLDIAYFTLQLSGACGWAPQRNAINPNNSRSI